MILSALTGIGIFIALHPVAGLVLLVIFAPFHTLLETEFAYRVPGGIGIVLLLLFLVAWSINQITSHQPILRIKYTPLYIPVSVFFTAITLTSFQAAALSEWATEWLKWCITLMLIMVILNMSRHWLWLVFGLVLAGCANVVIGIYIFLGGSGALHLVIQNGFFRAFGTFGQPNPFGGFMGLLSPIAIMAAYGVGLRLTAQWKTQKSLSPVLIAGFGFYLAAAALLAIGVFISWSRGAWLGFFGSMLVILASLPRKRWQNLLVVIVIGAMGAAALNSNYLPPTIMERVTSATQELFVLSDVRAVDITQDNYAIVERLAHWQAAIRMGEDFPWLGVGYGNYQAAYESYRLMNWKQSLGHAHNYYLNVFAEAGIIGLLSYVSMLMFILWMTWQTRKHPDNFARCIAIGLLGTWSYLILHSLTDNLYVNNLYMHIGVMLGILAVLHRQVFHYPKVIIGS